MSTVPRYEVHIDASFPHEQAPETDKLNGTLDLIEADLTKLGGTVTIQLARTTRRELPAGHPLKQHLEAATRAAAGDNPSGQYL